MTSPQLLMAINKGAEMIGVELSKSEIHGYLGALAGCDPSRVWDAICSIYRNTQRKVFPLPREITDEIAKMARDEQARRPLLDEPWHTEAEIASIEATIAEWKRTSPLFGGQR